jgi:hypothetical protein
MHNADDSQLVVRAERQCAQLCKYPRKPQAVLLQQESRDLAPIGTHRVVQTAPQAVEQHLART